MIFQVSFKIEQGFHRNLKFNIPLPAKPVYYRTFKYTWESTEKLHISGPLSPKILKFENGTFWMANRYLGTWVYNPKNPLILEWIIVGKEVQPFFKYDAQHGREWLEVGAEFKEEIELSIFETKEPFEISFSKIPFKPVIVFTDHCDFDSDVLLKKQREFFNEMDIKVTKGLFLKKFSHKGDWNSAFEGNEKEFQRWTDEGHELCYHSLSQSALPNDGNLDLFENFKPPLDKELVTWVDHGYQNYNISKSSDVEIRLKRLKHMRHKGIQNFWNYYDVGEVVDNLNQLDFQQVSTARVFKSKMSMINKLRILYFFNSSEENVLVYRKVAGFFKSNDWKNLLKSLFIFVGVLLKILGSLKQTVQTLRAQSIFSSEIPGVMAFQTIVVKDWVFTLKGPYKRLKEEGGLALIHSYFSFLGKHHGHTLFKNEQGEISDKVRASFRQLGVDIKKGEIWNPTLKEFVEYVNKINVNDCYRLKDLVHYRCLN